MMIVGLSDFSRGFITVVATGCDVSGMMSLVMAARESVLALDVTFSDFEVKSGELL